MPGVWGPYHSAVFSEGCINEGGQSVTGKLVRFSFFGGLYNGTSIPINVLLQQYILCAKLLFGLVILMKSINCQSRIRKIY